ncbi:hypothetical protein, partial [Streptomyces sp. SM14]
MSEPHSHGAANGGVDTAPAPSGRRARTAARNGHRPHRSESRGSDARDAPGCTEARRLMSLAVWPPILVGAVASCVIGYLLGTGPAGAPGAAAG